MKKYWLVCLLMLYSIVTCYSAGMEVQSFKKDDKNFKATLNNVYDINGAVCCVIKIIHNLSEDISIAEDKAYKREIDTSQIVYFWISKWEKNITISAKGYLPYKYSFPMILQEGKTYELYLQGETESIDVYDIPVRINTNPQGAIVYIDDVMISSPTPLREFFDSGIYPIKIELENYSSYESYINIGASGVDTTYTLKADFGSMLIKSKPEVNMLIKLNGEEIGKTPIFLTKKSAGKYSISGYNEFYRGEEQVFYLENADTLIVELEPTSDYGTLTIKSNPNAEVFINDTKIECYENIILSPQTVTVRAVMDKHHDAIEKLVLRKGDFKEIEVLPVLISGDILVNPSPDSVKVELFGDDGEYFYDFGISKFSTIPHGKYNMVMTCNKYLPFKQELILKEGERLRFDQELVKASFRFSLDFPQELESEAKISVYDSNNNNVPYSTEDFQSYYLEKAGVYKLIIQTNNRVIFSKTINIDIYNSPKIDIRYMKFLLPSSDCKVYLNKQLINIEKELITAYEVGKKIIIKVEIPQSTDYNFAKAFKIEDNLFTEKKLIRNIDYTSFTNHYGIATTSGSKKIFYGLKLPIIISPYYQEFNGLEINLFSGNYGPTSGIYKFQGGVFNGINISALGGIVRGDMNGMSIAPITNITDNTHRGIQISLINYAKVLKGTQIGLINITGKKSKSLRFSPIINFGF